jgi:hypothetical protein
MPDFTQDGNAKEKIARRKFMPEKSFLPTLYFSYSQQLALTPSISISIF